MKKLCLFLLILVIIACGKKEEPKEVKKEENKMKKFLAAKMVTEVKTPIRSKGEGIYPKNSSVAINGKLRVEKGKLLNEQGKNIQLKGISSHGLQWYGDFANRDNIKFFVDNWGINVFRASMYTAEEGYTTNPNLKEKVIEIVDIAESLGIYVIIDWHMLLDNDPNMYKKEAKDFFAEMSTIFAEKKHVFYEICNEPNGDDITWEGHVKPYSEEIIPTIRKNDPNSIILVGSSTWSSDVDVAATKPLEFENIMYTFHFYAGSHKQSYRDKVQKALDLGQGVFVSEWGVTKASGDEGIYESSSKEWIDFLDKNMISHVNWSLSNKAEDCALLKFTSSSRTPVTSEDLTDAAKLVEKLIGEK